MSIKNVRKYFEQFGLADRIELHTEISDTVSHAAQILNCDEKQIVKAMTFLVKDQPTLIAMAGNSKISNTLFKNFFHTRPKMIPFSMVKTVIGHEPGAVTPFAVNDNVDVFLDTSLKDQDTVFAAGGSLNSTIRLTVQELEQFAKPVEWIDISK